MTPKPRTVDTGGVSEPPELAPVEQALRAALMRMTLAELEALAVAVNQEMIQAQKEEE